jgi:hypothetical protein
MLLASRAVPVAGDVFVLVDIFAECRAMMSIREKCRVTVLVAALTVEYRAVLLECCIALH